MTAELTAAVKMFIENAVRENGATPIEDAGLVEAGESDFTFAGPLPYQIVKRATSAEDLKAKLVHHFIELSIGLVTLLFQDCQHWPTS